MILYYDSILVGDLSEVFEHQGTWFGKFASRLPDDRDDMQRRLGQFITFCESWHKRLKEGGDPDADEFDQFGDIVTANRWEVVSEGGESATIDQAPCFDGEDVSWVLVETPPDRAEGEAEQR